MNKTYVKLGTNIFNLITIISMEFIEKDLSVIIQNPSGKMKYRFTDEKEFRRFEQYVKLFSTEFNSKLEKDKSNEVNKKEILI